MSSTGVNLENSKGRVVAVVHDDDDGEFEISEVVREEHYEGDDELSSGGELSSGEEELRMRFGQNLF